MKFLSVLCTTASTRPLRHAEHTCRHDHGAAVGWPGGVGVLPCRAVAAREVLKHSTARHSTAQQPSNNRSFPLLLACSHSAADCTP